MVASLAPIVPAWGQSGAELRAEAIEFRLAGATSAAIPALGFNGGTPGPTLRGVRGKPFSATFANSLKEPLSLYWPGVRGVTNEIAPQPIAPGQSRTVSFTPRDAGTFWYRAFTPSQSARGLHGLLVIDDGVKVDRDVPFVVAAWDGGGARPLFTVNGQTAHEITVRARERVRFRLLNASQNQMIAVRFDRHEAYVVGLDGHPAEVFIARDGRVLLAPGNRAAVMVDMALNPETSLAIGIETPDGSSTPATLRYSNEPPVRTTALPPPDALPANPLPVRMDFQRPVRAELSLSPDAMRVPNPRAPGRPVKLWGSLEPLSWPGPSFNAKPGQTVMLGLKNDSPQPIAFHLNGFPFRLLDSLDDGWKPYWLDTVVALPQRTTRIAFVADQAGTWPMICQPLQSPVPPYAGWFDTR